MPFVPEHFIDAMVQAARSHLPADLAGAAKAIGLTQKQAAGKALIRMFADAARPETPQTHPTEWAQFRSYARDDVASMRDVFFATMPLTRREWREAWAVDAINHRGVPVDMAFVRQAVKLSALLTETSNADIRRLTGGKVRTVNQSAALLTWIRYELRALPEVDRILTREVDLVEDEDGEEVAVARMSLGRSYVEELIAYLMRLDEEQGLTDEEWAVLQVLEVRLYGASATPKKYRKIEALVEPDGRVRGQYMFNGAAATGRMSGRGFQPQNLARATIGTLDDEADAIEMITGRGVECFADLRARWGPVGRTLSRLIRPSIVAPEGKAMVWADWSAIEARVLPWIANSKGGDEVVDVFRQNDADPSAPDVYKVDAGRLLGKSPHEITKQERQSHGKIPRLALGFGGSIGALAAMARTYGASFTEDEMRSIVDGWRRENAWATRLWDQIWEAVLWCMENPGLPREAGRMTYMFDKGYRRGTLFGVLPCGRPLLYPELRWADVEQKNKQTGEMTVRRSLTVRQARARVPLSFLVLCLAGDSKVLTQRGWVAIKNVRKSDLVWDGIDFVQHEGLIFQGYKNTLPVNGVHMTPDHKILTREGWLDAAQCEGHYGAEVRMPDGYSSCGRRANQGPVESPERVVASSVRLRVGDYSLRVRVLERNAQVCGPMHEQVHISSPDNARHVKAPGLHSVEECEAEMPTPDIPRLAQLRRSRNQNVRAVAEVRELLGRHGSDVAAGPNAGPEEQRRSLRTRELRVGYDARAIGKYETLVTGEHVSFVRADGHQQVHPALSLEPQAVYDLRNAGPRSRFVVLGDTGPFIVHNCNNAVQGTAASLLRDAIVRVEREPLLETVVVTHDEVVCLCDEGRVDEARAALVAIMLDTRAWAAGLPVAAEVTSGWWYSKASEK